VAASGLVTEHRKESLLSVVRKRKISSCRQGEGTGKHPIPQRIEKCREEEVGR
jgi:hypothetical protein